MLFGSREYLLNYSKHILIPYSQRIDYEVDRIKHDY